MYCEISKILLYKSQKDGGPVPPISALPAFPQLKVFFTGKSGKNNLCISIYDAKKFRLKTVFFKNYFGSILLTIAKKHIITFGQFLKPYQVLKFYFSNYFFSCSLPYIYYREVVRGHCSKFKKKIICSLSILCFP